jgi:hypothetical protein
MKIGHVINAKNHTYAKMKNFIALSVIIICAKYVEKTKIIKQEK